MSDRELDTFIKEQRAALQNTRFNPTARDMKTIRGAKLAVARGCTERTARAQTTKNG